MLFQSACDVAQQYKESGSRRKVLVIDFSLYSEVSSLLMGGQRPQDEINMLSALFGREMTLQKADDCEKRAEGLIRDLVAFGDAPQPKRPLFGGFFSRGTATRTLPQLQKYWVQPNDGTSVYSQGRTKSSLARAHTDTLWRASPGGRDGSPLSLHYVRGSPHAPDL